MKAFLRLNILFAIVASACGGEPASTATAVSELTNTEALPPSLTPVTPTITFTSTPILTPTPFGGGAGTIAFASTRSGNYDIFLMNLDGSSRANLTMNSAEDQYPAWSPDGQMISFTSKRDGNNEIYVIKIDGSELINLTKSSNVFENSPTWQPEMQNSNK